MAEAPRWAAPVTSLLATAGLAVSAYLTWVHYTEPTALSCPNTGVINCTKVTTSSWSMVGFVPVVVFGLVFFAVMLVLCLPVMWRASNRLLSWARIGLSIAGIASVLYLVGVELLALHAICLWCTAVHVLTFGLFVVVLATYLHVPELAERHR